MLTMMLGVGLFGVLTGFLANAFIPSDEGEARVEQAIGDGAPQISDIRELIEEQERVMATLRPSSSKWNRRSNLQVEPNPK